MCAAVKTSISIAIGCTLRRMTKAQSGAESAGISKQAQARVQSSLPDSPGFPFTAYRFRTPRVGRAVEEYFSQAVPLVFSKTPPRHSTLEAVDRPRALPRHCSRTGHGAQTMAGQGNPVHDRKQCARHEALCHVTTPAQSVSPGLSAVWRQCLFPG